LNLQLFNHHTAGYTGETWARSPNVSESLLEMKVVSLLLPRVSWPNPRRNS
jgi:hypothetical protein